MKKLLQICQACGASDEEEHMYRHLPKWIQIEVKTDEDGKETYIIDADDFDRVYTEDSPCPFPQCGKGPQLHGSIIKHEYQGYEIRGKLINFILPKSAKCRSCDRPNNDHLVKHHFTHKVELLNGTETDRLSVVRK